MSQAEVFEGLYGTTFDEGFAPVPISIVDLPENGFHVDATFETEYVDDGVQETLTFPDGSTLTILIQQ